MPTQPTYDELQRRLSELEAKLASCPSPVVSDPVLQAIGFDAFHIKVLESLGDGIVILDRDFKILYQNRVHRRQMGSNQGRFCFEAHHGRHAVCEHCLLSPTFTEGAIHSQENSIRKEDGEHFVEITSSPLEDDAGNRVAALQIVRDISERRQMEEELFKIRKLESLGILAGGIAHDFNNLLTAIQGNISLARTVTADSEMHQLLAEADAATVRARNLTGQLLTFSKGGEPIRKPLALPDLLREAVRFALRGSNVASRFEIATDLWPIAGDEGQLSQVFHNLTLNADQAMPEGGMLTVRAENRLLKKPGGRPLASGRYVQIAIEDPGIGISPVHLDKIFDPYFSTKKKGSGLGLASAYSIVKRHNGLLTATSILGRGSVFTILLPATDQTPTIDDREEELLKGSGRILIMDDEEHVRKVAARMLTHLGYEPETVADGHSALHAYRQAQTSGQPFAAVLMDLTIPGGMGGKEAIKELLAIDPQAKAVVSSGHATDPIMANYRQFGFIGVIPKPYDLNELRAILREALG